MPKLDVEISPLAFSKIIDWTSSNTEREIGGYLIGHIEKSKVIITEAIFATAESNPTFVSFDNMMQFNIIEDLEKKGKNETIVGWFHSHPGLGCFMSGTDVATQKIYQALLPESVAMVNDGNKFAKTRNQSDFQAHFYRTKPDSGYHEISFGVLTDPNELLGILTDYVQSEENAEKIAQDTARYMVLSIDDSLKDLTENKLLLKEQYEKENTTLKENLASIQSEITDLKRTLVTNEEFASYTKTQDKEISFLSTLMFILLGFTSLSLIFTLVVFILALIP
ncbi:MAG TPA: Mov34/MPN/PAD-1 family protein [Candidatus Bathyarchaeia archaeon]|nr:Mov34/MPN/PAD-1 family protein [Candidatus Bathyarchaeia archaeon]